MLSPEKVNFLWEQMLKFPFVFDDFTFKRHDIFVESLTLSDNLIFEVWREGDSKLEDMAGLVNVSNVQPYLDGLLHFLFFDRKLRGKEDVMTRIIVHVMDMMKLRRITCAVPSDRGTGIQILGRLGFSREGRIRKKFLRKEKYLDVIIYGLLREEVQ